jgi:hypothetical protein
MGGALVAVLIWAAYTALFWLVLAISIGDANWFLVAMAEWNVADRVITLLFYAVFVPGLTLLCIAGAP